MLTVRRLYLYAVAAIALSMFLGGLGVLGGTFVETVLGSAVPGPSMRNTIASAAAAALVGLVGWFFHWRAARRLAASDAHERASILRRLYLYGFMAVLLGMLAVHATLLAYRLLQALETGSADNVGLATAAWDIVVLFVAWTYHLREADIDRSIAGEIGGAATIRRWYGYGVQLIAMVVALFAVRELLIFPLHTNAVGRLSTALDAALAAVSVAVWLWQQRWTARRTGLQEHESTLRAVAGFVVIGLAVALVVGDAHRLLYLLLARALGVEAPGGIRSIDLAVLVRPLSTIAVFGVAWAFARSRLAADAVYGEPARQAAVRRLYEHLVAFLAILALASGLSGLLWNVSDWVLLPVPPSPDALHDQIALFTALCLVALPLWLTHWRPAAESGERWTFSRRLYLFATLAIAVVATLASSAALIATVLNGLLSGELATQTAVLGRPFSVMLVAGAVGIYHWRMLRADALERSKREPAGEIPEHSIVVRIRGASEEQVRRALEALPEGARYAVEERADG